jgi:tetratricopeptide (TPR) repeat protein
MLWAAALVFAAVSPVAAQAPSPLELVRGIREAGMPDLAMEYLNEIKDKLTANDKAAVPLERAKCLLDMAEDEPDEGTRTSMVGEANEAFNTFLATSANHPRASEASLALARLKSIAAQAQLNRGRRMELPPKDDPGFEAAQSKQREEMRKAQPLFKDASTRFTDAAKQLKEKLNDPNLDPSTKLSLTREVFDANLASAINKYHLADTFLATDTKEVLERDKYLEEARDTFAELAKGPPTSRTVWIGRAWMAEVLADQGKGADATTEFTAIMTVPRLEAEEGKRLVRFFQIRRAYLANILERTNPKLQASETELRAWLAKYGNLRKPTPEALAVQFYLAFDLQLQALNIIGPPPKDGKPEVISETARTKLKDAEKYYRVLAQSDNDYTVRANRNRMLVVRKLLGDADKAADTYVKFEEAQMAALIHVAKLNEAEKALERAKRAEEEEQPFWQGAYHRVFAIRKAAEMQEHKHRVVELLERARELASDKDAPADVTDNLLRLVYFYQTTDQPFEAAVLGEHIARTIKSTGGKGAIAGLLALNGYMTAASSIKSKSTDDATEAEAIAIAVAAARKADRERAMVIARYLDEKYPNDTATDSARHRLAAMLYFDEKKYEQAFDIIVKIRPGYTSITNARQLEGIIASFLISNKDSTLNDQKKREVFHRAVADLGKVAKPPTSALEEEVRGYIMCRLRLAYLMLAQGTVEPDLEKNPDTRGSAVALRIANEVIGMLPTFEHLLDKSNELKLDGLNVDGYELKLQGFDVRTRALYLEGRYFVNAKDFESAGKAIEPVVEDVKKGMLYDDRMKTWANIEGDGTAAGDKMADTKQKIARLAAGIDKSRRDIVMLGFKLRCVQGKKADAETMLTTLKQAGGGIEVNQSTLEAMARELAAQIKELRREGKVPESNALGDGLTILLKEFQNLKDLPTGTILFLGTTFYTVGQYEDALKEFQKIKVPVPPGVPPDTNWWTVNPDKVDPMVRNKFRDEIRDYRYSQLHIARCYRMQPDFDKGETLLTKAIGDQKVHGYAYSSLDFRKELGYLHEAKAATLPLDKAGAEWSKGILQWNTLVGFARTGLQKTLELEAAKPNLKAVFTGVLHLDTGGIFEPASIEQVNKVKNDFYEAYFEVVRVVVAANTHLTKDPTKLAPKLQKSAEQIKSLEDVHNFATLAGKKEMPLSYDVAMRYWELLEKNPALKKVYQDPPVNGKFFLTKPKPE